MGFLRRFFKKDTNITLGQKRLYDEICKQLDEMHDETIKAKEAAGNITETPGWTKVIENAYHFYKPLFEGAAEDVQELLKHESFESFIKVEKGKLFHELLLLNLWIIDVVYSDDKNKIFIDALLKTHLVFLFSVKLHSHIHNLNPSIQETDQETEKNLIKIRFDSYNNSWDMKAGGRQFIFANQVCNNIFGKGSELIHIRTMFNILTYTFEHMKHYYIAKAEIKDNLPNIKTPVP